METPAIYGSDQTPIRPECLRPFAEGWAQPTAAEVRTVLRQAGLTGSEAAKLVGISDGRTVRRWTGGDTPIPYAAWVLLCQAAGYGDIHSPSRDRINVLADLRELAASDLEELASVAGIVTSPDRRHESLISALVRKGLIGGPISGYGNRFTRWQITEQGRKLLAEAESKKPAVG